MSATSCRWQRLQSCTTETGGRAEVFVLLVILSSIWFASGITKRSEYGSRERQEWLPVKRQQAMNAALTTSLMSTRGGRWQSNKSIIHISPSHFAGAERVSLGLWQTGGEAVSAVIPPSWAIARGWSWRSPPQPSWSTEWQSGTHGGTRAGRSRGVASCWTPQLWTIVKGEGGEEGWGVGVREFCPSMDKHDQPSNCLVTMLLLNQLSTSDPRSATHHQQACFWNTTNQRLVKRRVTSSTSRCTTGGFKSALKKRLRCSQNIESSALAAEVLWRWRRLGPASEISFFYVLPLQRYHCVGILCFMPNPSQNSHILPAVIRRSRLTDYFGQNLHET